MTRSVFGRWFDTSEAPWYVRLWCWCRVWFNEAELRPGDSIIDRVEAAIDDMRYLIVILSPSSMNSSWVKRELNMAAA